MHSDEHKRTRVLGERECDQVSGASGHFLQSVPAIPEPLIPILSFNGSPSAVLQIPSPTVSFPPHVGPFPVH